MCDFCSVLALLPPAGTAARPFGHSGALHTGGAVSLFVASALIAHRLAISHVIPLQLLQILNWCRCNCNVCGRSPKVTAGNYVRVLPGLPLSLLVGSAARPFGYSGALHTGGAVSLMCGSVRRLGARPGPAALQSCLANFACNSRLAISKCEFMSLELQRF